MLCGVAWLRYAEMQRACQLHWTVHSWLVGRCRCTAIAAAYAFSESLSTLCLAAAVLQPCRIPLQRLASRCGRCTLLTARLLPFLAHLPDMQQPIIADIPQRLASRFGRCTPGRVPLRACPVRCWATRSRTSTSGRASLKTRPGHTGTWQSAAGSPTGRRGAVLHFWWCCVGRCSLVVSRYVRYMLDSRLWEGLGH
jgi:hypothetical protein